MPWFLGDSSVFSVDLSGILWGGGFAWLVPFFVWSLFWTGLALWHAARRGHVGWFIAFLFVHTAGILEIIYLLYIARVFGEKPIIKRLKNRKL